MKGQRFREIFNRYFDVAISNGPIPEKLEEMIKVMESNLTLKEKFSKLPKGSGWSKYYDPDQNPPYTARIWYPKDGSLHYIHGQGNSQEEAMKDLENKLESDYLSTWNKSFREQKETKSYNKVAPEALVRTLSHYCRAHPGDIKRVLDLGCGAGATLDYLRDSGFQAIGVDVAEEALALCRAKQHNVFLNSATYLPISFRASFDAVLEANVLQHLRIADRRSAYNEISLALKPGGIFIGYGLSENHSILHDAEFREKCKAGEPLSFNLNQKTDSPAALDSIGFAHFFSREEILNDCAAVGLEAEVLPIEYELPKEEAARRGHRYYVQHMWLTLAKKGLLSGVGFVPTPDKALRPMKNFIG